MDVRFLNPFIRSICNTFETMCGLSVTVGKPMLKKDEASTSDVSGVIGFSGDAAGSVVLHYSFDVASKVATAFAGIEITQEHEDFTDAIGELANMVAGGAKSQFEGMDISISLPNVVIGQAHVVQASKKSPRIVIPCATDAGSFDVEVGMELDEQRGAKKVPAETGATA